MLFNPACQCLIQRIGFECLGIQARSRCAINYATPRYGVVELPGRILLNYIRHEGLLVERYN